MTKVLTSREKSPSGARKRRLVSAAIIGLVLAACAVPMIKHHLIGDTIDFHVFYRAARAFWDGQDIYAATKGFYVYPPLLALLLQPLLLLPERIAATAWMVVGAILIWATALIASKEMVRRWHWDGEKIDMSLPWIVAAVAIVFAFDKIHAVFALGQNDALMILGFACVLRWMERRPIAAGLVVGAAANVRYLSLIFVPYFLLKRSYRAAITSLLSFIFFLFLPAVETGIPRAIHFARSAFGVVAQYGDSAPRSLPMKMNNITWPRSVSLTSAVFRLTRGHGWADAIAAAIVLGLFLAIMAAIILIARRRRLALFSTEQHQGDKANALVSLEWAILIFVAMAFSPHTTARHMILLLLLYPLAVVLYLAQTTKRPRMWLLAATVLMTIGVSFPPNSIGLDSWLWPWRGIGGASWCAVAFILTVVTVGSRTIAEKSTRPNPDPSSRSRL